MRTGYRGTFVIAWDQTETDGLSGAPVSALAVGASWSWSGNPVRVDGPQDLLVLRNANGARELGRRAARSARRLAGAAARPETTPDDHDLPPAHELRFTVTDGLNAYTFSNVERGPGQVPLLIFLDDIPPPRTELWVISMQIPAETDQAGAGNLQNLICFASGTRIRTADGDRLVEDLTEGDRILTRDDGTRPVVWTGSRRITGARLHVNPALRPIRIRHGALGNGEPDDDLLLSSRHRVLLRGPQAQILFGETEVLVAAGDLINDRSILTDHRLREVTYHHLLLERHQVVWANGVETETFHPADMELDAIAAQDRRRLFNVLPELQRHPQCYGSAARRVLGRAEAAILQHGINGN